MKAKYVEIRLLKTGKLEIVEGGDGHSLLCGAGVYTHYNGSNGDEWSFIVSKNDEKSIEKAKKKMFSYLRKEIEKELIPLQKKLTTIKKFEKQYE